MQSIKEKEDEKKEVKFSPQQEKAITTHGRDILVSAAAGSGKTAVLVERVIRMILEQKASIDRILIVTFTKAATAEMSQRISAAIHKELEKNPDRNDLKQQISLLNKSSITTIDSFFHYVVSKYFKFADIDPNYKIAADDEFDLRKKEILKNLFDEYYDKKDKAFIDFINRFGDDNFNDDGIMKIILNLYNNLQKVFDADKWIEAVRTFYSVSSTDELKKTSLYDFISEKKNELFGRIQQDTDFLLNADGDLYSNTSASVTKVYEYLCEIQNMSIDEIIKCQTKAPAVIRKNTLEKSLGDSLGAEDYQRKYYCIKFFISQLKKLDDDEIIEEIKESSQTVNTIISITEEFSKRFLDSKKEDAVFSFSDITKFCIKILIDKDGNPTPQAKEINSLYDAVIIDEYQDSDYIQDTVFKTIANADPEHKINRFMVGDIKQCIYGFRNADPKIFIDKYESYSKPDNNSLRIDLNENYRSRETILSSINKIFEPIMKKSTGNVDYDESASLKFPANNVYEGLDEDTKSEFYMIEDGKDDAEADFIAKRIYDIVNNEKMNVFDKSIKGTRPIEYRDVVILVRSTKSIEKSYVNALAKKGIPAFCSKTDGYFDKTEIRLMMSLLKLVDNPHSDIELISALHSPVYCVTADELMEIKQYGESFCCAFRKYMEEKKETSLYEKLDCFKQDLESWKKYSDIMPVSNLIYKIYYESGYISFVNMLEESELIKGNIDSLIEMAVDFEKFNNSGLFGFIRYIDDMIKSEKQKGEASVISESDNVVKILNIHKSKGLEYPVVFVSNLSKKFNMQDLRNKNIFDTQLGMVINRMNYKKDSEYDIEFSFRKKSVIKDIFEMKIRMDLFSEEMRILYVALTRAREKLILTGTFSKAESVAKKLDSSSVMPYYAASPFKASSTDNMHFCGSFMDWLIPTFVESAQDGILLKNNTDWSAKVILSTEQNEDNENEKPVLLKIDDAFNDVYELDKEKAYSNKSEDIIKSFSWKYEFEKSKTLPLTSNISQMNENTENIKHYGSNFSFPKLYSKKDTSAHKGTVTHLAMEHIDFSIKTENEVNSYIDKLEKDGFISSDENKLIDRKSLVGFLNSDICARIQKSKNVKREQHFMTSLEPKEVYGSDEYTAPSDRILIRGIIDLFFEEDERIVIVDYKTNQITKDDVQRMKDEYALQLGLYKRVLSQAYSKHIDAYLYLLTIDELVEM